MDITPCHAKSQSTKACLKQPEMVKAASIVSENRKRQKVLRSCMQYNHACIRSVISASQRVKEDGQGDLCSTMTSLIYCVAISKNRKQLSKNKKTDNFNLKILR